MVCSTKHYRSSAPRHNSRFGAGDTGPGRYAIQDTCDKTITVRPAIITASAVYTKLVCGKLAGHDGPCCFKRPDVAPQVARPVFAQVDQVANAIG